jgi:hypothetical protein
MKQENIMSIARLGACMLYLAATIPAGWAQDDFDETKIFIEINATDGDAGLHALLDGEGWKQASIDDPDGKTIFYEKAKGNLLDQGLTENFFESAEPLCAPDPEDPEAEVVPLAEFLERFPSGEYVFTGKIHPGEKLGGTTSTLTYNLPAAPDISMFDGTEDVDPDNAMISWAAGLDLGEKCHDDDLISDGVIADPVLVNVVGWEVVVEPADDEAVDPLRVFSVQLPPGQTSVTVSPEYLNTFPAGTEFKFEVGAIEESGNQTFSEGSFCTLPSCPEENGEEFGPAVAKEASMVESAVLSEPAIVSGTGAVGWPLILILGTTLVLLVRSRRRVSA